MLEALIWFYDDVVIVVDTPWISNTLSKLCRTMINVNLQAPMDHKSSVKPVTTLVGHSISASKTTFLRLYYNPILVHSCDKISSQWHKYNCCTVLNLVSETKAEMFSK